MRIGPSSGELTGGQLKPLPAPIVPWDDSRFAHPDAEVLSRETGYHRSYGNNPYAGYDDVYSSPFLYDGPDTPGDLPPMTRVVTVNTEEEPVAYPYKVLRESPAINGVVDGEPLAILRQKGTASALDEDSIDAGRDGGSAGVFSIKLDGRMLAFRSEGGGIFVEGTSGEWIVLGEAVAGELEGKRPEPVVSTFRPETRTYEPQDTR